MFARPGTARTTFAALAALVIAACSIDRLGTGAEPLPVEDAAVVRPDARIPDPDGGPVVPDARVGRDGGGHLSRDAGACPEGLHDLDGLAGCEYPCVATEPPEEICDDLDNDCDGQRDNLASALVRYFRDGDGDGHGTIAMTTEAHCGPPPGFSATSNDCNDASPSIYPTAIEDCNGIDDDCNTVLDDGASCPCMLVRSPMPANRPYLFCDSSVSWLDAEASCAERGYHLATINDDGENTFLYTTARGFSAIGWWVGYHDRTVEERWDWIGGGAAVTPYERWHMGEPNDGTPTSDEDCAHIGSYGGGDATWNDYPCEAGSPFVCEVTR